MPDRSLPRSAFLALALLIPPARAEDAKSPKVDFDRQVRPILSNHCFACHGPDEETREAGLRFDVLGAALKPTDPGPARRSSPASRRRARSSSGSFLELQAAVLMPPPEANKPLSDADRAILRAWVEQGADFQTHWSLAAPKRPPAPSVKDARWSRGPIDAFLLARMEAEGLEPSPEANKETLIRRVTLDLTGLPPTPTEVDAFLKDSSPDAYEKLVDRLLRLASIGERRWMALDWLDAARYADTHGYHIDSGRDMTRWREWVIDAYNKNLPFDRFTVEQLAGDLLPNATVAQKGRQRVQPATT